VKPQGDVLFEIFELYGTIKPGVCNIFTPREYPKHFVLDRRKLWQEQYLLESLLSFAGDRFEIACGLNWLWHDHRQLLSDACPGLTERHPGRNPGSFRSRRRPQSIKSNG
tara:strand:+ start:8089 stop:8418 length:330 start_codon:yes stop_codon:yes gene_type:complete